MKELQSLGLDMRVQDADGNEVDIKQNYDDDDMGFDNSDLALGDDVMVESELARRLQHRRRRRGRRI